MTDLETYRLAEMQTLFNRLRPEARARFLRDNALKPGQEWEDIIERAIPGVEKAMRGSGIDFITRKEHYLEVKGSNEARASRFFNFSGLGASRRKYDNLILVGKLVSGSLVIYDVPRYDVSRVSNGGKGEMISVDSRPHAPSAKRLERYLTSLAALAKKYG